MNLTEAKKGQLLKILNVPNEKIRAQAIRFGLAEGETVICAEIVPAGPVVVRKNKQEIAIGRNLAQSIAVTPA